MSLTTHIWIELQIKWFLKAISDKIDRNTGMVLFLYPTRIEFSTLSEFCTLADTKTHTLNRSIKNEIGSIHSQLFRFVPSVHI